MEMVQFMFRTEQWDPLVCGVPHGSLRQERDRMPRAFAGIYATRFCDLLPFLCTQMDSL